MPVYKESDLSTEITGITLAFLRLRRAVRPIGFSTTGLPDYRSLVEDI